MDRHLFHERQLKNTFLPSLLSGFSREFFHRILNRSINQIPNATIGPVMDPNVKQSIAVSHVKLNDPFLKNKTALKIKFNKENNKHIAIIQENIR
ncbi:hypothetical protein RC90_20825 [Pectobacterium brasiliense]|nr:hypothetical protein B5S52_10830 [Pectobacterium brasiliense]KHS92005.1 hypothetical protein RC90_20825 [Pectobacterium brasiliense]